MAIPVELAFVPIPVLGHKLRAREFTAVELAVFFLDRLERLGPSFNALVTLTRPLALGQAERADRELIQGHDRGPLHGIPYGAKDLLATSGIPTTWGAAPLRNQVFDEDATVIHRLREAGAVLIGKLAMVELAGGLGYRQADATFTGPGLNPWDRRAWAGGSSSGSGAAVGAGLVPFAIGSETWGSIMSPAGYCGVAGLRPTYGRVSRHGAMALCWTLDKLGPLCRTAEDCGLVLRAIAGHDPADDTSSREPYEFPGQPGLKPPFKLATLKGGAARVQAGVKENFESTLEVLRGLGTIEEVELPELPYSDVASTILSCEMAAAFEGLIVNAQVWELTAPECRPGAHAAQFIPARDYINALRIRRHIQRAIDQLLRPYDAIITPTMAAVAPPLDRPFREYYGDFKSTDIGGAGNAAGIPAISIPNGFGERHLPTGVQLVGRAFGENNLLAVARAYQAATDWHKQFPQITEDASKP